MSEGGGERADEGPAETAGSGAADGAAAAGSGRAVDGSAAAGSGTAADGPAAERSGSADTLRRELARLLDVGGEPDAGDALDVLWIARLSGLEPVDWARFGDRTGPALAATPAEPPPLPKPQPHRAPDRGPEPPSARLHLPGGNPAAPLVPGGAHTIRVTQPRALPDVLPLARALRPLRQRTPSARTRALDVEATAAAFGDSGLLLPVLRPAVERRFSVDLLIDTGMTMTVWNRLADELHTLLQRHGAFADVRAWALHTDGPVPTLAPFRRGTRTPSSTRRWRETLADPTGRRAVLILTDGVGPAWYGGELTDTLAAWSRRRPVTALQVLPSRLWGRTALRTSPVQGRGTRTDRATIEVRSSRPLSGIPRGRAGATARARISWLPVLEVSDPWLRPWARLVSGRTTDWTPLRAAPLTVVDRPAPPAPADDPTTPAAWIERFEEGHSPDAFRLLRLLAAAPLSLPVMRLIQYAMLPTSTPMHLAEIFLSGLLVRRTPPSPGEDPDRVLYDFRDGVRDALLDRLTRTESVRVLQQVYEGVSEHVSRTMGGVTDFAALVASAMERGPRPYGHELSEESRAFAEVAWAVFNGVGGDYAELAARLGGGAAETPVVERRGERERRTWLPWRRNRRGAVEGASGGVPALPEHYVRRGVTSQVCEVLLGRGRRATCVIEGASGVGKTVLAAACATEVGAEFTMVRWLRAHSRESLRADLADLAVEFGIARSPDDADFPPLLHRHLQHNPGWLLIFDGVGAEGTFSMARFLPPEECGSTLVTLAEGAHWPWLPYETVTLDDFSGDSALEYVRSTLASVLSAEEQLDLVETVGTHPLTLATAVSHIRTDPSLADRIVTEALESRAEVAGFLPSLVWVSRDNMFIGTGVAVLPDTVITASVINLNSGAYTIHQPNGPKARVTALGTLLDSPGLTQLTVSTRTLKGSPLTPDGEGRITVAAWITPRQRMLGQPLLRLKPVRPDTGLLPTSAALIDEHGNLRSLVGRIPQKSPRGPLVYFSYANPQDRPFVRELSRELRNLDPSASTLGVDFDASLRMGADWEDQLKLALATAAVFVPVYSPRYFASDWYGKEWDAFSRRQQLALRITGFVRDAIVPVVQDDLERLALPRVAQEIQYLYPTFDLSTARSEEEYRRMVHDIAATILDVARAADLPPCDPSLFDDLRNAFADDEP
ncbi:toll/interleukin-1 receptor domain-containing protein [Streptomyces sp. NPDC047072]|uniref:toll/interleukin-1 receptor domain-containing protein n=1 Tax=Streptomyces sp. NPDC047072 TaxID=3154809 RepID=UPI0033F8AA85